MPPRQIRIGDDTIEPERLSALRKLVIIRFGLAALLIPLIFLLYIPIIMWRIAGYEKVLHRDLPGYDSYLRKMPYRLLPFIW